jgi:hypothetical protein
LICILNLIRSVDWLIITQLPLVPFQSTHSTGFYGILIHSTFGLEVELTPLKALAGYWNPQLEFERTPGSISCSCKYYAILQLQSIAWNLSHLQNRKPSNVHQFWMKISFTTQLSIDEGRNALSLYLSQKKHTRYDLLPKSLALKIQRSLGDSRTRCGPFGWGILRNFAMTCFGKIDIYGQYIL